MIDAKGVLAHLHSKRDREDVARWIFCWAWMNRVILRDTSPVTWTAMRYTIQDCDWPRQREVVIGWGDLADASDLTLVDIFVQRINAEVLEMKGLPCLPRNVEPGLPPEDWPLIAALDAVAPERFAEVA